MEIVLLCAPLAGAILCGLGWRVLGEASAIAVASALMALGAILAWLVLVTFEPAEGALVVPLMRWIESGSLSADWALRFDGVSVLFAAFSTTLALLVLLYGQGGVQKGDERPAGNEARLAVCLSMIVFAALVLITADNLIQLFFGWQLLGIAMYLAIGARHQTSAPNRAAARAFTFNAVADVGLLTAIAVTFLLTDSIGFDQLFGEQAAADLEAAQIAFFGIEIPAGSLLGLLVIFSAMGRSGQILFHPWALGSAAVPAATMAMVHSIGMAAGALLLIRMAPVFELSEPLIFVGTLTAVLGVLSALTQRDLRAALSFGSISIYGVIFALIGLEAVAIAFGLLVLHGFGHSAVVLAFSSAQKAIGGQADLGKMGGLKPFVPGVRRVAFAGSFVLVVAAYVSLILAAGQGGAASPLYGWVLLISVLLGILVYDRLDILVFGGEPALDPEANVKPISRTTSVATWLLAATGIGLTVIWFVSLWNAGHWLQIWFALFFDAGMQGASDQTRFPMEFAIAPAIAVVAGVLCRRYYKIEPTSDPHPVTQVFSAGFYIDAGIAKLVAWLRSGSTALAIILDETVIDGPFRAVATRLKPWFANEGKEARLLLRSVILISVYAGVVAIVVLIVLNAKGVF